MKKQANKKVNGPLNAGVELTADERAFLYQQTVGLHPYLIANSEVAILVQKEVPESEAVDGAYRVQFGAKTEVGKVEAFGRDLSFYSAARQARESLEKNLRFIDSLTPNPIERDQALQAFTAGGVALLH